MSELHRTADKLFTETDHLERVLERVENQDNSDPEQIKLALSVAKRVRSESTLLVRALARIRDQLQP